jgi:hypothetical protein
VSASLLTGYSSVTDPLWPSVLQANIQVAPQKVQQAGFDTNGQTRSELRNAVAGANNDDANNPHAVGGSLGESAGAKKLQFTYTWVSSLSASWCCMTILFRVLLVCVQLMILNCSCFEQSQGHKLGQVGPVQVRAQAVTNQFKAPLLWSVPQITIEI